MMDMHARNQYLETLLRERGYHLRSKKEKSLLLDEYCQNTGQARKYVIRKIRSGGYSKSGQRKRRRTIYDGRVMTALTRLWRIFDYPCGQRLAPLAKIETARLRAQGEITINDVVAEKLTRISPASIDRVLRKVKSEERIRRRVGHKIHPLLYQKIPVKVMAEQDRTLPGHVQIDLVEHCGASAAGEFAYTLSTTDIATGWWEGEAVMGKAQEPVQQALDRARGRYPFPWAEIHSDNGAEFINNHLFRYAQTTELSFSRSRPYKKNDNCLVEQKNWTHVKKFVGYLRYDTPEEQTLLADLYRDELRLYKNFFQPVIKLKEKVRVGGRIHRRYDIPQTPCHRTLALPDIPVQTKQAIKRRYRDLNPAQLKRTIDRKLDILYRIYKAKQQSPKVEPHKKLRPRMVTFLVRQPMPVSVT
jgi:hypothetical protein